MFKPPQRPLVAVVGATGTGKSQLAVEIARKYNGEIINSDAMQMYEGLPIITNKVTEKEKKGVRHHLLSVIGLDDNTWTVDEFSRAATAIVDDIHNRGKLPILVGGTHYYTQTLLFGKDLSREDNVEPSEDLYEKHPILKESNSVILEKLKEVDPVMASRWHPNDHRKIQRSLAIYLQTGKPASQIYEDQRQADSESLRCDPLVFWIYAPQDILVPRLDARVDKMVQNGLVDEVRALDSILLEKQCAGQTVDRSRGIWPSIGYKEFETYQTLDRDSSTPQDRLEKAKAEAIELVKIATRQYAKYQLRWIRIKLVHALRNAQLSERLFLLNGGNLERWTKDVKEPALAVTTDFLAGRQLPLPETIAPDAVELLQPKQEFDVGDRPDLWTRKECEVCKVVAVTEASWEHHVKSQRHKRALKGQEKREEREEYVRQQKNAANGEQGEDT